MAETVADSNLLHSKEQPGLEPISELRVVVHPLFRIDNPAITELALSPEYRARRQELLDYVAEAFTPTSQSEVTAIMPALPHRGSNVSSYLDYSQKMRAVKRRNPDSVDWRDVLRSVQSSTEFPNNVFIANDFQKRDLPQSFPERLKHKGFEINSQTTITVGGEWLDACVMQVVNDMLAIPQVRKLRVDKKAQIGSSYSGTNPTHDEKGDIADFMHTLSAVFTVSEDNSYIYVGEKKSKVFQYIQSAISHLLPTP